MNLLSKRHQTGSLVSSNRSTRKPKIKNSHCDRRRNGVDLFFQGTETHLPVEKVVKSKDTIGAGDTFFAHFVVAMFQGKSPTEAVKVAIQKTSEFLERKTKSNKNI